MKRRSQPKQRRAPAPYTKQHKKPFVYSPQYYAWKQKITGRKEGKQ